jgi:hypothetical protein
MGDIVLVVFVVWAVLCEPGQEDLPQFLADNR